MLPILMAAMAGLQLVGSFYAAENARVAAELNGDIADLNAEFADLDAYDALSDGRTQVARYQSVVDSTLGEQTAILAAQDVDVSFGSASTIADETSFIAVLNKMEIEKNAQERALGFKREARDFRLSGFLTRLAGETKASEIQRSGVTSAISTGISGYSSLNFNTASTGDAFLNIDGGAFDESGVKSQGPRRTSGY